MRRLREAPRTQDAALPRPTRVPRTSSPPPPRGPAAGSGPAAADRSEEHTSELQSQSNLVCRLLLEKKKRTKQPLSVLAHVLGDHRHCDLPIVHVLAAAKDQGRIPRPLWTSLDHHALSYDCRCRIDV